LYGARGRRQEAGDDAHGGGLAGAVGPQEADHLALTGGEGDPVDRDQIAIAFRQLANLYHRNRSPETADPLSIFRARQKKRAAFRLTLSTCQDERRSRGACWG